MTELINGKEAAKILNTSLIRLNFLIKDGCLKCVRIKGKRVFKKEEVEYTKTFLEKKVSIWLTNPKFIYFLGFFWADGYMNSNAVSFEIAHRDIDISNSIDFIKWNVNSREKKLGSKTYKLGVIKKSDIELGNFLKEKGAFEKSYNSTKIIETIPNKYLYLFFRGYIDGDGCISTKNKINRRSYFSVTGDRNKDWSDFEYLFNLLEIKHKISYNDRVKNSSSYLEISNRMDISKIYDYLYQDNTDIGLNRKKILFEEIKNRI